MGRFAVAVALAILIWPGTAYAHSRAPAVALDYRLRIDSAPHGVSAHAIDGDRELQIRVDPAIRLVVRGLLGEPLLRFAADGVWVNGGSPTAAVDRLVRPSAHGWKRLTRGHSFRWHDHRLSPPAGLKPGSSRSWSLPVVADGHSSAITGTFTRVPRPTAWPWLVGALAAIAGVVVIARRHTAAVAAVLAAVAAAAALAANFAFAQGDAIARPSQWIGAGAAAALTLVSLVTLATRDRAKRTWISTVVGALAGALTADALTVFWHGVVISSLPPSLARAATAIAFVGGSTAAVLGVLASEAD